jgi:hypothetical protein
MDPPKIVNMDELGQYDPTFNSVMTPVQPSSSSFSSSSSSSTLRTPPQPSTSHVTVTPPPHHPHDPGHGLPVVSTNAVKALFSSIPDSLLKRKAAHSYQHYLAPINPIEPPKKRGKSGLQEGDDFVKFHNKICTNFNIASLPMSLSENLIGI